MSMRAIVSLAGGNLRLSNWVAAAEQEPPVQGKPVGCPECPLRSGGEWDAGLTAAVQAGVSAGDRRTLSRWGCHASTRPCAGMRRILGAA